MSNVVIYFGTQPSSGQIVADQLKSKGINLLKVSPDQVHFHGGPTTVQPGFALYKAYLPLFIAQAICDNGRTDFTDPYGLVPWNKYPTKLPIRMPALVGTWATPIGEEVRAELRDKHGFKDTIVKGKAAMIKENPLGGDIAALRSKGALENSPCNENSVNIFALRRCNLVLSIASVFLRVHQYPAFIDDDHESEFNSAYAAEIRVPPAPAAPTTTMDDDSEMTVPQEPAEILKRAFKVTLPQKPGERALYFNEATAPQGSGLLFSYEPGLAKFDRSTVLYVIKKYFYAGLADDLEDCVEEFENLKIAWGNITNSSFANQMSHLYKCIDIALTMQCCPIVMMSAGVYEGVFMWGGGFQLHILGRTFDPAPQDEVLKAMRRMNRHSNALWDILQLIPIASDDRQQCFRTYRNIWKLKERIDAHGVGNTANRDTVLARAVDLQFPDNKFYDPTAFNIDLVLSFISDPLKDITQLSGLHPSLLFHTDRLSLALGSFGASAPSFRVPGGKEMSLTSSFRVTSAQIKKDKGPQGHRDVTKIACIMQPLEIAIAHMKIIMELKTVLNPFGNAVVNASSSHIHKVYDGESCTLIVGALRKVSKVTVVDTAAGGGAKRKGNDEDAGRSKRGRMDLDDF